MVRIGVAGIVAGLLAVTGCGDAISELEVEPPCDEVVLDPRQAGIETVLVARDSGMPQCVEGVCGQRLDDAVCELQQSGTRVFEADNCYWTGPKCAACVCSVGRYLVAEV